MICCVVGNYDVGKRHKDDGKASVAGYSLALVLALHIINMFLRYLMKGSEWLAPERPFSVTSTNTLLPPTQHLFSTSPYHGLGL